uniref:CUB domain-containing protein n=1 Tax=Ciona savignyi TaxID=51511 RepID=H2ZID0_CIOSA
MRYFRYFVLVGFACVFGMEDSSSGTTSHSTHQSTLETKGETELDLKGRETAATVTYTTLPHTVKEQGQIECGRRNIKGKRTGFISSPGFPRSYKNNATCLWAIEAPVGYYIRLSFDKFDLEMGVEDAMTGKISCDYDYVYLFEEFYVERRFSSTRFENGRSRMRRSWGTYCHNKLPPDITTYSPGSTLFVYFRSDESETGAGFFATFQIMKTRGNVPINHWGQSDYADGTILKVLSMIVFAVVLATILAGVAYRCLRSTAELGMQCCSTNDHVSPEVPENFSPQRLPTPPPTYGEVVKTEEDWNRVIAQLGEASATAIRRQLDTERLQVTYDLSSNEVFESSPPGYSSASSSFTTDSEIDLVLTPNSSITQPAHDQDETRQIEVDRRSFTEIGDVISPVLQSQLADDAEPGPCSLTDTNLP